jgi:LysR family glycine cleavage system transcriptional activator
MSFSLPRRLLPPIAALLAFEAAARLESFTGAAAELNLTQGAVSRQVKLLEEMLGVALFPARAAAGRPHRGRALLRDAYP